VSQSHFFPSSTSGHECCPLSDYVELSYRFALLGQRDEFDFLEALSVIPDNYVCLGFLAVLLYHSEIYAVIPREIPRAKLLAQGFIDGLKRKGINPTDLTHTERLNLHEQFILGEIYFEGMVYPRNSQLAWALMTISAKAGHCDAMVWLGSHVFSNSKESYLQSRRTSFDWLMLAAEEFNHPQAQCLLGYYFETGNVEGVPRDLTESIKRYKSAADDGFAEAQCRLANLYYNESRHTEAIPYWTRSCEQGYTSAIFTFAEQLIFFPYAHDPVKAVELYKRNISFGDLDVTCVYASILEHGHCGFPQDLQEASRLKAITKQHKYKPTPLVLDVLRSIREKSKTLMRKRMMMANHELVKLGAEVF
jgi:TPR repeat protein